MKEDTYAASSLLGKLLCGLRLHKYCDHPRITGTLDPGVYTCEEVKHHVLYFCPKCEQEFYFNGEKFIPLSPARYCLRGCGHFKIK